MLPKLTVAFFGLTLTAAIVACSSLGNTSGVNVGPNFPTKTLYASNSNQNAISIYSNGTKNGGGPAFQIGGASTTLNGPQYLAFDRRSNLWVTNYNPSTNHALLIEFEALATGDVLPLNSVGLIGRPRGIAFTPKKTSPEASSSASPVPNLMAIADNDPTITYPNRVFLFAAGQTAPYQSLGGPRPHLRLPSGVAIDSEGHLYVTNIQGQNVESFTLPTPSPTPKPAILVFPPYSKKVPYTKPIRKIQGCNTKLSAPTDVKVDSAGITYVADSTATGSGIIWVFQAGAKGDVAPTQYTSPGAVTGLGIVP
jgi:hypothetical protein